MIRLSIARLRGRGGRSLLVALGIAAAGAMLGTAITVAYGLGTGFDRAADRADLPDVVARFDRHSERDVQARLRALPNVAAGSLRFEVNGVGLRSGGHRTRSGVVQVVQPGRRGYAVVDGS